MYKDFFKLKVMPFENIADSRFYFLDGQYRDVLASLVYAVTTKKGLMAVVGMTGCGKTTIGQNLTERLPKSTRVVYLVCLENRPLEILDLVAHELGVFDPEDSPVIRLNRIKEKLTEIDNSGGIFLLIIDEAQGLSKKIFIEIQNLSNLETNRAKLVQIVLLGRSKLQAVLNLPQMSALRQRLAIIKNLTAMDSESVFKYIKYRLRTAGIGYEVFSSEAMTSIFIISRGIPRQINKLCDMCLLKAFLANQKKVDGEMVVKAAAELGLEIPIVIKSSSAPSRSLAETTTPPDQIPAVEAADGLNLANIPGAEEADRADQARPLAKRFVRKKDKQKKQPSVRLDDIIPKARPKRKRYGGNWLRTAIYTVMLLTAAGLIINLVSPDFKKLFNDLKGIIPETAKKTGPVAPPQAKYPGLNDNTEWKMATNAEAAPKKSSDFRLVRELPSMAPELDSVKRLSRTETQNNLPENSTPTKDEARRDQDATVALLPTGGPEGATGSTGLKPPTKFKHEPAYPFSLMVSTFTSPVSTAKAMEYYNEKRLSPYWVKMTDAKGESVYCIYVGLFPDKDQAALKKNELGLEEIFVVNTPYAGLIDAAESPELLEAEAARLLEAGYFPYIIPSQHNKYLLLVGAYKQLTSVISECESISAQGFNCEVIER